MPDSRAMKEMMRKPMMHSAKEMPMMKKEMPMMKAKEMPMKGKMGMATALSKSGISKKKRK